MQRTDSLGKILMLGKIEGKRRLGQEWGGRRVGADILGSQRNLPPTQAQTTLDRSPAEEGDVTPRGEQTWAPTGMHL